MADIFERASRVKLRFATPAGDLSVEDLWSLPLTSKTGKANLDTIAVGLHKKLQSGDNISFVETDRKSDDAAQLAFDLVKHIIGVRIAENEAERTAKDRAEKKQLLLSILADKESEAFKNMSADDLKKQIAAL